jgi:hypothetical protein
MMIQKKLLISCGALFLSMHGFAKGENTPSTLDESNKKIQVDWFKKPTVTIKGKLSFIAGTNNAKKRESRVDQVSFLTTGDFGLNIFGEGYSGNSYGAMVSFDLRREKVGSSSFIKAAYAYYNDLDYGTFQVGEMEGAIDQALMDGRDIMGATSGFDGSALFSFVSMSTGVMSSYKHATYDKKATKIFYKTPVMSGFQLAFSFVPHSQLLGSRSRGQASDSLFSEAMGGNKSVQLKSGIEGVLSYGFDLSGVDINLYAGAGYANPSLTDQQAGVHVHPAKVWQLGLIIDFGDIQLGAGYLDNGKSLTRKDVSETFGDAYNAAISYTLGRHYIAAGHMLSSRKVVGGKAKANISSLTYEYKAAPGLTVFSEFDYFDTRNTSQYYNSVPNTSNDQMNAKRVHVIGLKKNNKGGVLMFGTSIRF